MNLEDLRRVLFGDLIERGSATYSQVANLDNARFDQTQPLAVALCTSADDVRHTVAFVRRHGLPTAIRSGGHCFAGRSTTEGVTIDVTPMADVSVSDDVATIGAGARLGDVYEALLAQGRTIPGGTCPAVGIGGFVLGGGFGMLGRAYGLASDHLLAASVVLSDGRLVECDRVREPDLFWALRGAGNGQFGVVTDLTLRTIPVPTVPTTFSLTWPVSDAVAVLGGWLGWLSLVPDEMAANLVVRADGSVDEPVSVEVYGTMLGSASEATTLLQDLSDLANAEPASFHADERSYPDMVAHWAERALGRLEHPGASPAARHFEVARSEFFVRPLPAEALEAVVDQVNASRRAGETREIDLSPWGGAYNRTAADATAFVHRDWRYWIKHAATLSVEAPARERDDAAGWVTRSWNVVRPWGTGHVYPNFPDLGLGADSGPAYYGSNYPRLLKLKARYDPTNTFRFSQSLPLQ